MRGLGSRSMVEITDTTGRRLMVGNGYLPVRTITTRAGQVEVKPPRVADKPRRAA